MRTMRINKRKFCYCLLKRDENGKPDIREIVDEYGNLTGQYITMYEPPVEMWANISPATGQSNTEQFGNLENYDKVIVTDELDCPIDENSVLFIDKEPEYTEVATHIVTESETVLGGDEIEVVTVSVPAPDHTVRRVAKSINSVSIAVRKVNVS